MFFIFKKYFVAFFVSLFVCSPNLFSQNSRSIEKFKTGVFLYEGMDSTKQITRTKNKQIEVFNEGKSKLVFDVEWTSDTTYLLRFKKAVNAPGCLQKYDCIAVVINSISENSYSCRYVSNNCGEGTSVFYKID